MNTITPGTTVSCPSCKQSIAAKLEQLLDVGADPAYKQRLLSGKINAIECPLCSFRGTVTTPLVYHDPDKDLLLTYTPMELNLSLTDKEHMLGALTRTILDRIPSEDRKAYLLQPKEMLSMEGLINAILAADGVTPEMIEQQRTRTKLLQKLATATEADLPDLINKNDEQIDELFFQLLASLRIQAQANKDGAVISDFEKLEQKLLSHSTFGKQTQMQIKALQRASSDLEALGKDLTRDKFVDLIVAAKDNNHITSLITLARPAADYQFFLLLTEKIEASMNDERDRLEEVRALILETVGKIDAAAEEQAKVAAGLIQKLLDADDMDACIKDNIQKIDETVLMLLQNNIDTARKEKDDLTAKRLEDLSEMIMQALHESLPPEIRIVNELLAMETHKEAETMISQRATEFNNETLTAMVRAADQLRSSNRSDLADKLDDYRAIAEKAAATAKWRD